jgi:hypothetical protein
MDGAQPILNARIVGALPLIVKFKVKVRNVVPTPPRSYAAIHALLSNRNVRVSGQRPTVEDVVALCENGDRRDNSRGSLRHSGFSRSPLDCPNNTLKHPPLTVFFRPQVQTISPVRRQGGAAVLEFSTWAFVFVITLAVLLIILAAFVLWDVLR